MAVTMPVARATAKDGRHRLANLLLRRILHGVQEIKRCHQHTRGAETVLQRMMLMEGLLQRMQGGCRRPSLANPSMVLSSAQSA